MTEAPTSGLGGRLATRLRHLVKFAEATDDGEGWLDPCDKQRLTQAAALADRAGDVEGLERVLWRDHATRNGFDVGAWPHNVNRPETAAIKSLAQAVSQFPLGSASNAPPEPPANT